MKVIAITMGDPSSVGPELSLKALVKKEITDICRPLLIGDACVLRDVQEKLHLPGRIHIVRSVPDGFDSGAINVLEMGLVDIGSHTYGQVSARAGNAAFRYVEKAIQLASDKQVDATVTNAINKEAIHLAGHHFSGHTEIYAEYTNTNKYSMLLAHDHLRVVHVSTHVSLREACDRVKKERVYETVRIAHQACRDLGIPDPRVGVAGLNPHSGENGMFGREEIEQIIPAIEQARRNGIAAEGPIPPDTIFPKAKGGWYDIVVAMYHDQGHIPLKLEGFVYDKAAEKWSSVAGVNITLGLPIIRTSVDHGTAFDLVNRGVANDSSLISAVKYAVRLAESNGRHTP